MKLFITGFLQVFFVACNTYFISKSFYIGVFICGLIISLIWSWNVKKLFFGVCYWEDIYEGIFTDKMLYELPFEYKQFQKLLEWKFDVFGLIDAGLAEPITE